MSDITAQAAKMLEELRKRGWTKGTFEEESGAICLRGAWLAQDGSLAGTMCEIEADGVYTAIAKIIREQYPAELKLALDLLREEQEKRTAAALAENIINATTAVVIDSDLSVLTAFNDYPPTTFSDVERVLEKVIASDEG